MIDAPTDMSEIWSQADGCANPEGIHLADQLRRAREAWNEDSPEAKARRDADDRAREADPDAYYEAVKERGRAMRAQLEQWDREHPWHR